MTMPLVDVRIYTIKPRKMQAFIEVFDRLAMPVLKQTLGHPLGCYVTSVGDINQFVHLWGYASLADYEQRSAARDGHPDFPAYLAASGDYIVAQQNSLVRPAGDLNRWVEGMADNGQLIQN